jgi:hypothetical protein
VRNCRFHAGHTIFSLNLMFNIGPYNTLSGCVRDFLTGLTGSDLPAPPIKKEIRINHKQAVKQIILLLKTRSSSTVRRPLDISVSIPVTRRVRETAEHGVC